MRTWIILLALGAGCGGSSNQQNQAIGTPCTTNAQCGTGAFFCAVDHPNGYCKRDCHTNADCPSGSVCAGAGMVSLGECHKECTQATASTDCRLSEGYLCKAMPDDASHDYCDAPEPGDAG